MDNIIYFLLLIGWLAFSYYQQNEKKKKRLEQMRAEEARRQQDADMDESQEMTLEMQREAMQGEASEQKPTFKSTLEEWLLGEQDSLETIPENEAQSLETIPGQPEYDNWEERVSDKSKANVYQKYYDQEMADYTTGGFDSNAEKLEDKIEALEEEMVLEEEDSLESPVFEQQTDFNLRTAVIYSEILNRRY